MKKLLFAVAILALVSDINARDRIFNPGDTASFDFWIGDRDLTGKIITQRMVFYDIKPVTTGDCLKNRCV